MLLTIGRGLSAATKGLITPTDTTPPEQMTAYSGSVLTSYSNEPFKPGV